MKLSILYYRLRRKIAYLSHDNKGVAKWSNRISTKQVRPVLVNAFNENVLPALSIEITTDCNYRCEFCPQSSRPRISKYMTQASFDRIVQNLKKESFSNDIVLSVNNEPFMHPLLIPFCKQIVKCLPFASILLISNGSLIQKEHLEVLSSLDKPPRLLINDYTDLHLIAQRIEAWNSELDHPLALSILRRRKDEQLSNRGGNQQGCDSRIEDFQAVICTWPFMGMFVNADLKAFLCCSDYQHEVIIGDFATQTIKEIWQSEIYRDVRRKMLATGRKNLPLCTRCDAEWFALPPHCSQPKS